VNAEAEEVVEKVAEFRQLAKTKWSPVAAIKDEQKRAIGYQRRERAGHSRGIGKSKILGERTGPWILLFHTVLSS
jgi:hypothetical protein